MKCVSALSTVRNTDAALKEVADRAAGAFEGMPADLALIFASIHHADALGEVAARVKEAGLGRHVLGCTGESIVGEDREVEGAAALSLWALRAPGMTLRPRRLAFEGGAVIGWPELEPGPGPRPAPPSGPPPPSPSLILLADPFTFPTDPFLKRLGAASPAIHVIGGMA